MRSQARDGQRRPSHGPHSEPPVRVTQLCRPAAHGRSPAFPPRRRSRRGCRPAGRRSRRRRCRCSRCPARRTDRCRDGRRPSHGPQKLPTPATPARQDCLPLAAGSDAAGAARPRVAAPLPTDIAQAAVVDLAVAVVVQPVADLGRRRHGVVATSPVAELLAALAGLLARGAEPHPREPRGSRITILHRAGRADAPFVHLPVAVVVEPVTAQLDSGGAFSIARSGVTGASVPASA